MQFTPQQLAGGVSYSDSTRIGNWVEDVNLREYERAHFEAKRSGGNLELQRRRAKLASGNKEVMGNGASERTFVCYGDLICLDHGSGLRLGVDIWDEILPGQGVFSASGVPPGGGRSSTGPGPATRTTFQLEPYNENVEPGSAVCYGEKFRLRSLMAADDDAVAAGLLDPRPSCFLASARKTERMASRLTNRQLVYASASPSPETLWYFEVATTTQGVESAEAKYFNKGQPVEAGVAVVPVHVTTRGSLLADPTQTEHTDYGAECEVVCQTKVPTNVVSSLRREGTGTSIITVPLETPENHWMVTKV